MITLSEGGVRRESGKRLKIFLRAPLIDRYVDVERRAAGDGGSAATAAGLFCAKNRSSVSRTQQAAWGQGHDDDGCWAARTQRAVGRLMIVAQLSGGSGMKPVYRDGCALRTYIIRGFLITHERYVAPSL